MFQPILFFLLPVITSVVGQQINNATNSTQESVTTNVSFDISALFSDLSATDVALLVIVCFVIVALFSYLLRQVALTRARLKQVHAAETNHWQRSIDIQSMQLQPPPPPPSN